MADICAYEEGVFAVDSGYGRPLLDAIHLIVEQGRVALVDTGTNHSVPLVLDAFRQLGLTPEQVDYVILTHIHLDHAGGAGAFMACLPNARLVVHPRGVRHMADPRKLTAGTVEVYGEERARRLYGGILPVPAQRIIEAKHGSAIKLGSRRLAFLDTPGHARHHVSIVDDATGHIFTGDTFGLAYRELEHDGRRFVFPATTPVQFDPAALHRSVDLILSHCPEAIYVTHYGQVRDVPRLGADLHRLIEAHEQLALREQGGGTRRHERIKDGLRQILLDEARRQGWTLTQRELMHVFDMDIELNAQGLGVWLDSTAH